MRVTEIERELRRIERRADAGQLLYLSVWLCIGCCCVAFWGLLLSWAVHAMP